MESDGVRHRILLIFEHYATWGLTTVAYQPRRAARVARRRLHALVRQPRGPRDGALRASFTRRRACMVAHDIDNDAVRVEKEKPANAPTFVSQRVHNLSAPLHRFGVDRVYVCDLYRDLRYQP